MKTRFLVAMIALGFLGSLARGDEVAPEGDLAKLQGRWTATVGPEKDIPVVIEVKEKSVSYQLSTKDGQEFKATGEIKLDESAKPHKTVDWVKFKGSDGNETADNLGIYTINGDEFAVCNGGPGNPRPTEFKGGENGAPPHHVVFKRDKDRAAAESAPLKGDLAKFQGKWSAMVGPEKDNPLVVVFKGTSASFKLTFQGEEREFQGEIKLDESAKPHKTIDWIKFKRPTGEDVPPNLGIYEFDGEELKICSGGAGKERPTEFKAGEAGPPQLVVLKREGGD